MSREYARRSKGASNLPIIIAIVGAVIVVAVILYFVLGDGGASLFGGATDTPIPVATYTPLAQTPTPGPSITPTSAPTVLLVIPSSSPDVALITSTPTPAPAKVFLSATVWANSLKVREGPGLEYGQIGTVKYGQTFKVYDETTKFIKIQLPSGAYGWIWEDYTVRGDAALPAAPEPEAEPSWMTGATLSGSTLTVKFSKGVYGNAEHTVSLGVVDFTVKEGSSAISFSLAHTAGSDTATLTLGPTSGGAITVSIAADTVFDVTGDSSPAGSKTTGTSTDTTAPSVSISFDSATDKATVTFTDSDSTLTIDESKISVSKLSGAGGITFTTSTTGKVVTVSIAFDTHSGTYEFTVGVASGAAKDSANNSSASKVDTFTKTY